MVHNENGFPWEEGGLASDGVKLLAETGDSTLFSKEMDPLIIRGDAYVKISKLYIVFVSRFPESVSMYGFFKSFIHRYQHNKFN